MNSAACVGSAAAHAATAAFTSHPYYCHDGSSSSATAAGVLSAAASGVSSAAGNWSAAPAHANGKLCFNKQLSLAFRIFYKKFKFNLNSLVQRKVAITL